MTRKEIKAALAAGKPFTLLMADGKEYEVPHPDYLFAPPNASYVILCEEDGFYHVLPLITMTGLRTRSHAIMLA